MRDDLRDADRLAVVQDQVRFQRPGEKPSFETLSAASAHLREVLDGQRVLIVVDDAWRSADVEPFRDLGAGTAFLVTTRDGGTLPPGCRRVDVDAMQPSEAVQLLASAGRLAGAFDDAHVDELTNGSVPLGDTEPIAEVGEDVGAFVPAGVFGLQPLAAFRSSSTRPAG